MQKLTGEVPSTQDLARELHGDLPVVVIAPSQSAGRGRTGAVWENADSALAVSVAWSPQEEDHRPFSLMAGVAALRALGPVISLKWPNDILRGVAKVGGILVERSQEVAVAGLGLDLHWDEPPPGYGSLFDENPGEQAHQELGSLWAASFLQIIATENWPLEEYRASCATLGRDITWDPNGSGLAAGISETGALLVKTSAGMEEIHAGAIRHVVG